MVDKKAFNTVNPKVSFPEMEENLLKFWKENKIFEKSVSSRPSDKKWTILDGPPFITGMPHYGTLLSSIPKDIFPRYWTMKGYRVRRVWGWDCHGLPAENKVEKKLGLKRKKDIEEVVGIKKFIDECKLYVSEVSSEWEWYVEHIARWVDFKNAYKTMDREYMESVMWVFKRMYEEGYVYKGIRISLYCSHCETPISNFEVAMDAENYRNVTEVSNTYKYKLEGYENTYLLAWSTTPWTKITTTALAVNPDIYYVEIKTKKENLILAKDRLAEIVKEEYKVVKEMKGKDLIGIKYEPHFNYYKINDEKKAFVVIGGDFVTTTEGTGVVTIAPYGEEDLEVMEKEGIHIELNVNDDGTFSKDVPEFGGMFYLKANPLINECLKNKGLLYDEKEITHSMPHCWRCHEMLLYKPQEAWFVNVQKLKPDLNKNNENVNWIPKHFKYGRFLKSMESAPDWCISRSRYWGSPVPVWECEKCKERIVIGSISELEELSGTKIEELHKPEIDEVTIKCRNCDGIAKRVPEVLDSWIEAGSASFAERHFPFNKKEKLEDFFPPDFIIEYTGQIRAWFYVLHVIGTVLYKSHSFKNVLVTGVVLGTDGRKMSKNFGNYPDPKELLQKYGGDALRLYLMESPVMRGEDVLISEDQYKDQVKNFMLTLWNVYNFFVTYASMDNWNIKQIDSKYVLDKWILLKLALLQKVVTEGLEEYDTGKSILALKEFVVKDLSLWYIRRSRDRVGPSAESKENSDCFYSTTYQILVTFSKMLAPFAPFISEEIYKNLTKEESVHLVDWPEVEIDKKNINLIDEMSLARIIVEKIHSARKESMLSVKQPLLSATVNRPEKDLSPDIIDIIKAEVNIKELKFEKGLKKIVLDTTQTPELIEETQTRDLIRQVQNRRKELGFTLNDRVKVVATWIPNSADQIKKLKLKAYIGELTQGLEFSVEKI